MATQQLDYSIEDVEPIPSNYNSFVENVCVASRRHIPRGYRTDYDQGLTDESKNLYEAYKQQYSINPFDNRTMESGNLLLDKMTEEKRKILEEVITSTNMTHNSRKAWKTINKLSNDPTSSNPPCLVLPTKLPTSSSSMTEVPCHPSRSDLYYPQQQKEIPQRFTLSAKVNTTKEWQR